MSQPACITHRYLTELKHIAVCARVTCFSNFSGPMIQPTRQPVKKKALPAEPAESVILAISELTEAIRVKGT